MVSIWPNVNGNKKKRELFNYTPPVDHPTYPRLLLFLYQEEMVIG